MSTQKEQIEMVLIIKDTYSQNNGYNLTEYDKVHLTIKCEYAETALAIVAKVKEQAKIQFS